MRAFAQLDFEGLVTSTAAFVIVDLDYLNVGARFYSSVVWKAPLRLVQRLYF